MSGSKLEVDATYCGQLVVTNSSQKRTGSVTNGQDLFDSSLLVVFCSYAVC